MKLMIVFMVLLLAVVGTTLEVRSYQEPVKDILSQDSCKYLKDHGYLTKYEKLEPLCLGTVGCNDTISTDCCRFLKAQNQCAGDLGKFCELTCFKCGFPANATIPAPASLTTPAPASPTTPKPASPTAPAPVQQCNVPLGMESKAIPDSSITAFSYEPGYPPQNARPNVGHGWVPKVRFVRHYWLQVDLGKVTKITGIATKSGVDGSWVITYTLKYSTDKEGNIFKDYHHGMPLPGNTDSVHMKKNELRVPFHTRFLRISPKEWSGKPSLQIELYGCK